MTFTSLVFALFLAGVFLLHWARPHRRWQNGVLLGASYAFYGWWDGRFAGLMLGASLMDYLLGRAIAAAPDRGRRRALLGVSLAANLGLLGFFKYSNFFADSAAVLLGSLGWNLGTSTLHILLPVGISFYTFQTLSYTVDIYRGQFAPRRDVVEYLAFVSFFPQLVAGPIERATHLLPQFGKARAFAADTAVAGCRLVLWGLVKKMLVADPLGTVVDGILGRSGTASAPEVLLATVGFGFQIYGDFSGYSDMAAGLGRLFGIELSRNFAFPYFARSLPEFWRRWHISLSSWFKDYVYIPLGGKRGRPAETARNLLLTLLLSGLWHGAAWHFVAWGAWHGLGLAAVQAWRARRPGPGPAPRDEPTGRDLPALLATGAFVSGGWVWFRAADLGEALHLFAVLLLGWTEPGVPGLAGLLLRQHAPVLAGTALMLAVEWLGRRRWDPIAWERLPGPARWAGYTAAFWLLLALGTRRTAEFIYFQF